MHKGSIEIILDDKATTDNIISLSTLKQLRFRRVLSWKPSLPCHKGGSIVTEGGWGENQKEGVDNCYTKNSHVMVKEIHIIIA